MINRLKKFIPFVIKNIPDIKIEGKWLSEHIDNCITSFNSVEYNVCAIISDNHSTNVLAFKYLLNMYGNEHKGENINHLSNIANHIYLFFDPVYLLKNNSNSSINAAVLTQQLKMKKNLCFYQNLRIGWRIGKVCRAKILKNSPWACRQILLLSLLSDVLPPLLKISYGKEIEICFNVSVLNRLPGVKILEAQVNEWWKIFIWFARNNGIWKDFVNYEFVKNFN